MIKSDERVINENNNSCFETSVNSKITDGLLNRAAASLNNSLIFLGAPEEKKNQNDTPTLSENASVWTPLFP